MSTLPIQDIAPLPDFLQAKGPVTLNSIRKARKATTRGKSAQPIHYENDAVEVQVYFSQAIFDLSLRIDEVERFLKNKTRAETAPSEVLNQLTETLRELKLCADIGNFAIGQLIPRN